MMRLRRRGGGILQPPFPQPIHARGVRHIFQLMGPIDLRVSRAAEGDHTGTERNVVDFRAQGCHPGEHGAQIFLLILRADVAGRHVSRLGGLGGVSQEKVAQVARLLQASAPAHQAGAFEPPAVGCLHHAVKVHGRRARVRSKCSRRAAASRRIFSAPPKRLPNRRRDSPAAATDCCRSLPIG